MELARKLEVLDEQIAAANNGQPADFDGWRTETEVKLRMVMGEDSPLLAKFQNVRYTAQVWYSGMDTSGYRPAGVRQVIAILEAAKTELALREELAEVVESNETDDEREASAERGRVFIIHGHDDTKKHAVARVLHAITGSEPIILHEQPNAGRTIIEKLEHYAAASGFAVALLTADDVGQAKDAESGQPRARQNVVFEAGYFAGRLGRAQVVLLHEADVELPSDLDGVVYIPLDEAGAWRMKLAHEMSSQGISVDWDRLAGQ